MAESGGQCEDSVGSYVLPKVHLTLDLMSNTPGADQRTEYTLADTATFIGDRSHVYCLDYLPNAFSRDAIRVDRNKEHLLTRVYSRNEDTARTVIPKVSEAVADLIASRGRNQVTQDGGTTALLRRFEIDPFDKHRLAAVNDELMRYGYCVYVDPVDDALVPEWMAHMCPAEGAIDLKTHHQSKTAQAAHWLEPQPTHKIPVDRLGVFYKPVIAHSLVIMKRDDPTLPTEPWYVRERKTVRWPNRAPAFVLEIERALFNTRKTNVILKDGVITSVELDRDSAAEAVSEVIVEVVGDVVDIPARIISIAASRSRAQAELIRANQSYIEALTQLEEARNKRAEALAEAADAPRTTVSSPGNRTTAANEADFRRCIETQIGISVGEAQALCASNARTP